jgi:hypothetical protein
LIGFCEELGISRRAKWDMYLHMGQTAIGFVRFIRFVKTAVVEWYISSVLAGQEFFWIRPTKEIIIAFRKNEESERCHYWT